MDEYSNFIETKIPFNVTRILNGTTKCKHDSLHETRTELRICNGYFVDENGSTKDLRPRDAEFTWGKCEFCKKVRY